MAVLAPLETYEGVVLGSSSLALYWRCNDSSGTPTNIGPSTIVPTSGGGTITYSEAGALSGDSDKAITFAASATAKFSFADNGVMDIGLGSASFECWIKTTQATQGTIYRKVDAGGTNGLALSVSRVTTGKVTIALNGNNITTGSTSINDGAFHHLVAVVDRTNDLAVIYVDGAQDASASITSLHSTDLNAAAAAEWPAPSGVALACTLDEVAFYSAAMSAAVAKQHYAAGIAGFLRPSLRQPYTTTIRGACW